MLEVRILDIAFRVRYGINSSGPGSVCCPSCSRSRRRAPSGWTSSATSRCSRMISSAARAVHGHHGRRAAARGGARDYQTARRVGGNLDLKRSFPVPRFTCRCSMSGRCSIPATARRAGRRRGRRQRDRDIARADIAVCSPQRRGKAMKWPRAEDAAHHYVMGLEWTWTWR